MRGIWLFELFLYQKKYYFNVFEFLQRQNHAFVAKLRVSLGFRRPFWADGHQRCVSKQISIKLISVYLAFKRKIAETWILARVFAYLSSFFSRPDSRLHPLNGFWFLFWSVLTGVTLTISNCLILLTSSRYGLKVAHLKEKSFKGPKELTDLTCPGIARVIGGISQNFRKIVLIMLQAWNLAHWNSSVYLIDIFMWQALKRRLIKLLIYMLCLWV